VAALDVREERETAPVRTSSTYGSVVLGAILVVLGGLWLLDAVDVIELRLAVALPAVLAVVGIALIFGSFEGSHSGLVVFGIFLTVAVVAAAVTPADAFRGGIGERRHQAQTQAELAPSYRVGVGDLRIDLSELQLTESATVVARVGAGTIRIQLPADLPVSIQAAVGAGEIDLMGETADGLSVTKGYESPGFADAPVGLTLDLDVAAGEIEVTR
jgi:predicted membrane protein